jgi:hypothetical protein
MGPEQTSALGPDQTGELKMSVAAIARAFGVSWSTIWAAVVEQGKPLVDAPGRVGVTLSASALSRRGVSEFSRSGSLPSVLVDAGGWGW